MRISDWSSDMSALDDLKADLAKLRDEAKVQVHLGTMETKQEWEEIEAKWNRFVAEAGLHKSGEGIKAALQSLGNELRAAYQPLNQAIDAPCPLQFRALTPTQGGRPN